MKKIFLYFIALNCIVNSSLYSKENISKVDLEISLKKASIEAIINKELPLVIEDSGSGSEILKGKKNKLLDAGLGLLGAIDKKLAQPAESFVWSYKINRSPISFDAEGQTVQAVTDISGLFKANWNKSKEGTEMLLSGTAGIKSNISISPDWGLESKSEPFLNISNNKIPLKLDVLGLKLDTEINIGSSLEKSISSNLARATKELDSKIEAFDLKSLVEKNWLALKEPILLNPDYKLWLTVNPKSARYSDVVSFDENISIKVGTDVDLQMYFGEKPASLNLKELPKMNFGFVEDNFNIILPVSASYSTLTDILNKNFSNKEFIVLNNIGATLHDIVLSSKDSTLNLKGEFALSIFNFTYPKGIITASLKPNLNKENGTLSSEDFDYVFESDSKILNWLNKMFKNQIKNILVNKYLVFDPAKEISVAKNVLEAKVKNVKLENGVYLKSTVNSFKIREVEVTPDYLSVTFNTAGKSNIEVY
ncbi:MAG: DUF4403 family protein [Cetobacterium sp.]